jgi:hypothetical protein
MAFVIYFPSTGAVRAFDSYNVAEATYRNETILQNEGGVLAAHRAWARTARGEEHLLSWYETMFERIDSEGHLAFVDGKHVKAKDGSLHPRPKLLDDADDATIAAAFWQLATRAKEFIRRPPASSTDKKKGKPTGFIVDLVRCHIALEAIKTREIKVPQQVRSLIEVLAEQEFDYYDLKEMQRLCNSSAFYMKVKTAQDGWRIFRYYAPQLKELGVIK